MSILDAIAQNGYWPVLLVATAILVASPVIAAMFLVESRGAMKRELMRWERDYEKLWRECQQLRNQGGQPDQAGRVNLNGEGEEAMESPFIELDESDIETAVGEYLKARGYRVRPGLAFGWVDADGDDTEEGTTFLRVPISFEAESSDAPATEGGAA